jgi:hypothetical protein
MLQCGEYRTLAELADAEGIRLNYVCRVVRLMLLAPEIVDRILDGRTTAGLTRFLKAALRGRESLLRATRLAGLRHCSR